MNDVRKMLGDTHIKLFLGAAILYGWSASIVRLMSFPDNPLLVFGLWIAGLAFLEKNRKQGPVHPKETRLWGNVFAALISLCTWVGSRVVIGEGGNYSGLWTSNYLASFTAADYVRLIFLWAGSALLFPAIFALLDRKLSSGPAPSVQKDCFLRKKIGPISAAVLFLCWLPYALAYYPGLIFGDSIWSIRQAVGLDSYNNHYPLMYTFFIKFWLKIGRLFGSNELGCFFYTLVQMLILSAVFGYLLHWLSRKNVPGFWLVVITAAYAIMPVFPLHAISMWKDPLFSAALLLLMLLLFDIAASGGKLLADRRTLVKLAFLSLWICFFRNNGLYVMILVDLVLIIQYAVRKKHRGVTKPRNFTAVLVASVLCVAVVTGPVYKAAGIGNGIVETVGIPLQQMASVVVNKGNMSESDKAFLFSLMPEEDYSKVFTPCCVDNLKWDPKFEGGYLNTHKKEFFKTYFCLLLENPGIYAKEWVLQTYGFWTPNSFWSGLYSQGLAPLSDGSSLGIVQKDLFRNVFGFSMQAHLGVGFQFLYSSTLLWVLLFVAALLLAMRKKRFLAAMLPPFAVLLTLLISTPLAEWLRYVLIDVYALPLILLLPWIAGRTEKKVLEDNEKDGQDSSTDSVL